MRSASGSNDAAPLATAMRAVAGPVEVQLQADQRGRSRLRLCPWRVKAPPYANDGGLGRQPLTGSSWSCGQRFQLAKAFGKIEGPHGARPSKGRTWAMRLREAAGGSRSCRGRAPLARQATTAAAMLCSNLREAMRVG
jgi:hypothetical protein